MGAAERRSALMKVLYIRRHDKIANLATEFGVSERTIRRDIEVLSLSEPIYTQCGRYGGGVYVMKGYSSHHLMLSPQETGVLEKILTNAQAKIHIELSSDDLYILKLLLQKYAVFR